MIALNHASSCAAPIRPPDDLAKEIFLEKIADWTYESTR